MQNSVETPDVEAKGAAVDPIPANYVPFEEQSLWVRRRPWIWAAIIMFFVIVGFAAVTLPQLKLC